MFSLFQSTKDIKEFDKDFNTGNKSMAPNSKDSEKGYINYGHTISEGQERPHIQLTNEQFGVYNTRL